MKILTPTWMALSFFGYYCAYSVFMPFFPAWLKANHYTEATIGLLLASSYLFRFLGALFFSATVKRASHLIRVLRLLAWGTLILLLIMQWGVSYITLLVVSLALFSMFNAAGMPLSDTLANTWQQQLGLDYGKIRLAGSFAFAVGVTVFGYVIGWTGAENILWILTALCLLYALLQMLTPKIQPQDRQHKQKTLIRYIDLLKNKTTTKLLMVTSLIQGSHAAYYAYSVLYWTSLGIDVQIISLLWGISVLAEITLFFFSSRWFGRWSVSHLFYVSAIACVVRWGLFAWSEQVGGIILMQLLHSLTYALSHYAMVRYITCQPQEQIAKLQALYNGLANCVAVAILTALTSVVYTQYSPVVAFLCMLMIGGASLCFIPHKIQGFLVQKD